jgi:segregation and condensation protein A
MREKIRIVITFIALLELAKAGRILIKESPDFNDFVLTYNENG